MAPQEWLERLQWELARKRLPRAYAERLLEEWTDHFHDLQKENQNMEAQSAALKRLGTPELLAATAEREYMRRTCAGRRPWLVFLVAPLPLYLGLLMALAYPLVACKTWIAPLEGPIVPDPSALAWVVTYASAYSLGFLPPFLAAAFFCYLGIRAGRPAWSFAACLLVAYVAFVTHFGMIPPSATGNLGCFMDWELGLNHWQERLAQAIPPFALGIWTWQKLSRQRKNGSLPFPASTPIGLGVA